MKKSIAAVDPGRDKCGVAVLSEDGEILYRRVVPTPDLITDLLAKKAEFSYTALVMGNGTTSGKANEQLTEALPGVEIAVIDEYNTTQLAKKEYWKLNPPKGWRKLLPLGLQVPPEPVDDIVAVILARRYLKL